MNFLTIGVLRYMVGHVGKSDEIVGCDVDAGHF